MKYSYIFEINKALSQAYKRNIQLSFPEYGATEEDLAADIDCALEVWRKNVDQFRSDNSDRFTAKAPMPPEVRDLCFFLKECQGIARRRANQVTGDSDAWEGRAFSLAIAVGIVTSYFPDEGQSGWQDKNQSKTKGETHRPTAQLKDYLNGVTVDAFKEELLPKVQGNSPSGLGEIVRKEVRSGRLTKRNGYIAAFLRAFDIYSQNNLNGIRKYLKRRTGA